ncbi:MAG: protein phosphatase 2C domain-containing protein [Rhabdochlamydiaceae bacterium]|nr:protein phosphatase 2C domain-containing protein [Candidatus Amphrikana amoebophyrae]
MASFNNSISQLKFKSYGTSDIGLMREKNEDCFAILQEERFFALADGMGGHKAGEIASKEAVSYLCQAVRELFSASQSPLTCEMLKQFIHHIFQNANSWVYHLSNSLDEYQGMGTTLSSALIFDNHLITSHIGDSRIYLLRNKQLELITTDHTSYDKCPKKNSRRKVLTQVIGSSKKVTADTRITQIQENDLFLICSDGLTDYMKENTLYDILSRETSLVTKSDELIVTAKESGSSDNITALMIEIH